MSSSLHKIRKRKLLNPKSGISRAAGIAKQNPVEENDQLKLVLPKSVENIGPVESFFYFKSQIYFDTKVLF